MLNLYRYQNADSEDVTLADRTRTEFFADGMWLAPTANNADKWAPIDANANSDSKSRLARMVFMEAGRSDSAATGKMTTIVGDGVRGYTDQFVGNNSDFVTGNLLTLTTVGDAAVVVNGVVTVPSTRKMVLTKATNATDIIKAVVVKDMSAKQPYLYFEFRNQN